MLGSAFLEITRECNLRCLFCSNESYEPLLGELSTEDFIKLVDDLYQLGVIDLRLYGGEPFLRSDAFQIIGRAQSHKMAVTVYSNGTIFNEGILYNLKKQNVRKLSLSVDSSITEVHDRICGVPGSFKQVVNNIKILTQSGIPIDVLLTICCLNKSDITSTYRFLHSLGVNDVKANFVSNVGKAREHWDELSLTIEEMQSCVREINEVHSQLFGRIPIRKLCQAGTGELFIAANGDVFPCALFLDPAYRAGNIKQKTIREIWEQPEGLFVSIREVVERQFYCQGCDKKQVCGGGCRARAAALHDGDLEAPDISSCIFHKEVLR